MHSLEKVHELRQIFCYIYEPHAAKLCQKQALAEWELSLDLNNPQKSELVWNASINYAHFRRNFYEYYLKEVDIRDLDNKDLIRQIKKAFNMGNGALKPEMLEEMMKILNQMQIIYNTAKICPYKTPKCDLGSQGIPLIPDVERVLGDVMDYDELLYTWIAWHDATGAKIKKPFEFYVVLANEAAIANNYSDHGEMWRDEYEVNDLEDIVDGLWEEVEPLYNELQTFVRHRLRAVYHKEMDWDDDGYIPAHLLGNMWGQNWLNIKDLVVPFALNETDGYIDITEVITNKNITVHKMFEMANEFYKSMGLEPMDDAFDVSKGAVIQRPTGKKGVACQASAWDFCNRTTFKIRMCAESTFQDFITIHHELGHIQYYMLYKDLPLLYRTGANPSFHEAIGDTLALSVLTPNHFHRLNLTPDVNMDKPHLVNMLMNMALVKVAFLPFGYLLDKWRWDIFAEKIDPEKWNEHYWFYRMKYQKVKAPIVRSTEDFDPGAKFHICSDTQYISYFLAYIMSFQIHQGLCPKNVEFYECDLQNDLAAGSKLRHALRMGGSRHWSYVLKDLTGSSYVSAGPMLEYFEPLYKFLKNANEAYKKFKIED